MKRYRFGALEIEAFVLTIIVVAMMSLNVAGHLKAVWAWLS